MDSVKDKSYLLHYTLFWNWLCCSRDYIFKGGKKPINNFPEFFHFYVYENAPYVNTPDYIIKENPEKTKLLNFNLDSHYLYKPDYNEDKCTAKENSSSFGLCTLKGLWDDFLYETISHFNQESKVSYFARDSDNVELYEDEARYEITLNMDNHIGKVCFIMPNLENKDEDTIINTRVFLPKLNLTFNGSENFQIKYNQNKKGIGFEDNIQNDEIKKNQHKQDEETEDSKLDITNQDVDCFYFNKPFYMHVYVDNLNMLSLYVGHTIKT